MKTFSAIKPGILQRSSLALGFFDGVHPGHQSVIKKAVDDARLLNATPAIVTFREHPRALTLGKSPPLLTTPEQRLEICAELGIEVALLLSFTEELCRLAPEDYVQQVLVDCMGACSLSVGYNHRFGRNRIGTPELLAELGKSRGFTVHVAPEIVVDGSPISSSRIRESLTERQPELTQSLLGRPYAVKGVVERGDGRGRTIGFPTANIGTPEELILPPIGVYSGSCKLQNGKEYSCIINIGIRPTFGKSDAQRTEVHIFDFDDDLYGQELTVRFLHFVRSERKFAGVDELKAQIEKIARKRGASLLRMDRQLHRIELDSLGAIDLAFWTAAFRESIRRITAKQAFTESTPARSRIASRENCQQRKLNR